MSEGLKGVIYGNFFCYIDMYLVDGRGCGVDDNNLEK